MALDRSRSKARNYAKIFPAASLNMQQFGLPSKQLRDACAGWHGVARVQKSQE